MQKLRLGTVELAIPSSVMSSAVDAFGMFEMPYLVKNREHMKKIEAGVVWPSLAPMADAKGYQILADMKAPLRAYSEGDRDDRPRPSGKPDLGRERKLLKEWQRRYRLLPGVDLQEHINASLLAS